MIQAVKSQLNVKELKFQMLRLWMQKRISQSLYPSLELQKAKLNLSFKKTSLLSMLTLLQRSE